MRDPSGTPAPAPADDFPHGAGNPARSALRAAGYTRLAQLTEVTAAEVLALHGVGPKAIGVLREALAAEGLVFAGE
ncbi:DNA-binding protein [Streptomyces californicus]|uniref:DNA-binding protein n=1 Tax=Streptomyces TaxID=1883 RepID=UPI0015C42457|nr:MULTISPECIES: DNA-binding protein [Streptomyces]MBK0373381.1 DNA-binding protein [Streptomyces sp. RB110-1]MBK0390251.1 DNA-binding protein [Streptomyces sp. RB110-2]MDW4898551.1 DNA-binding protein [Streptomyces californicus]QLG30863.1 DNA-binding protein [Streptomyces sp. CB04723]